MKLTNIKTTGLLHADWEHSFESPVTVFVGENGAGKTTVLHAIALLTQGVIEDPSIPRTNQGVMRLARDKKIVIEALFEAEGGAKHVVTRVWKRDKKGGVKEEVAQDFDPSKSGSLNDQQALLRQLGGGLTELWNPYAFLMLPPARLRSRLITLLCDGGSSGGDLRKLLPDDLPSRLAPSSMTQPAEEWLRLSIATISRDIIEHQTELRKLEAILEGLEDAFEDHATAIQRVTDELSEVTDESLKVGRRLGLEARLAEVKAGLEQRPTSARPDDAAVEEAEQNHTRAEEVARAAWRKREELGSKRKTLGAQLARLTHEDIALGVNTQPTLDVVQTSEAAQAALVDRDKAVKVFHGLKDAFDRMFGPKGWASSVPPCASCGAAQDFSRVREEQKRAVLEQERVCGELTKTAASLIATADQALRQQKQRENLETRDAIEADLLEAEGALAALEAAEDPDAFKAKVDLLKRLQRQHDDFDLLEEEELRLDAEIGDYEAASNPEDLKAHHAELVAELERLTMLQARRQELTKAASSLNEREGFLTDAKAWKSRLVGIETQLLKTVKDKLETSITTQVGRPVEVSLVSPKGLPDCRFMVGGVDWSALSDGESMRFMGGVVTALLRSSQSDWRPLLLDRLEAISKKARRDYLKSLVEAVEHQHVSQVLICGCPDDEIPDDVPGIRTISIR